jgi:hypothetical protein
VFTWVSGDVYSGEWKKNKKEGHGVRLFSTGDVYRGEYKGDKKHGFGVFTFGSGAVYRGEYKDDKKEGFGAFTFASGKQTLEQYENGDKVSSVPFDAASAEHAAVLCAANDAEARRFGPPHWYGRNRLTFRVVQATANTSQQAAEFAAVRIAAAYLHSVVSLRTRLLACIERRRRGKESCGGEGRSCPHPLPGITHATRLPNSPALAQWSWVPFRMPRPRELN